MAVRPERDVSLRVGPGQRQRRDEQPLQPVGSLILMIPHAARGREAARSHQRAILEPRGNRDACSVADDGSGAPFVYAWRECLTLLAIAWLDARTRMRGGR